MPEYNSGENRRRKKRDGEGKGTERDEGYPNIIRGEIDGERKGTERDEGYPNTIRGEWTEREKGRRKERDGEG